MNDEWMNKRMKSALVSYSLAFPLNFGGPDHLQARGLCTPKAPKEETWASNTATGSFNLAHQRAPASPSPFLSTQCCGKVTGLKPG